MPVEVFPLTAELGLGPKFDNKLDNSISGLIRRLPDNSFEIVVNGRHHENRQRFTAAHEIGHFIFHRDRLSSGTSDTLAYRIDGRVYPNPMIGPEQERQANNFAANLLVPTHYLRGAQAAGITDPEELATRFKVSLAVMRIKLGLSRQPGLFDQVDEEATRDRYGFDER